MTFKKVLFKKRALEALCNNNVMTNINIATNFQPNIQVGMGSQSYKSTRDSSTQTVMSPLSSQGSIVQMQIVKGEPQLRRQLVSVDKIELKQSPPENRAQPTDKMKSTADKPMVKLKIKKA